MDTIKDMLDDMTDQGIVVNSKKEDAELSGSVSFADCPNKCVDGYYVDPYKHKRIKCLYCAEKRISLVKNEVGIKGEKKDINSLLNLPSSFTGYGDFSVEKVIPEFSSKVMIQESVELVGKSMQNLIEDISVGTLSDYSIMFNLGKKAFENNFIYSYLVRAFYSGLVVSPLISDYDLCILRNEAEYGVDGRYVEFNKYVNSDVCVVVIMAGATTNSINVVKGLMQLRANKGHSTIIFTNSWSRSISNLCTEDDVKCKNLAYLYSIEYDEKYLAQEKAFVANGGVSKKANSTVGLSSDAFNNLMRQNNSL